MPRRAVLALLGAGAGVALLALTWFLAFHVGVFERADQSVFLDFGGFSRRPHVDAIATFIAHLCNPQPYVYLAAAPVVVALARRRGWLATAICAILLGANITTHLLKPLLAHPRASSLLGGVMPVAPASWPSGHATAVMSLTLCWVLAAPARMRPRVAAAGAAFTVAVCYSFLTLGWHYPSDVFGGFLVAATWTLLGVVAVLVVGGRPAASAVQDSARLSLREALAPPGLALLAALALGVVVLLARPHEIVTYAHLHHVFVAAAATIAAVALALATGLTLALRR